MLAGKVYWVLDGRQPLGWKFVVPVRPSGLGEGEVCRALTVVVCISSCRPVDPVEMGDYIPFGDGVFAPGVVVVDALHND